MTSTPINEVSKVKAEAAYWFTRINSGEASEQELREFRKWHSEDPEHERCYRYIRFFCDASFQPSDQDLERLRKRSQPVASDNSSHVWRWLSGGVLFLLSMLAMIYVLQSSFFHWHGTSGTPLLSDSNRVRHYLPDGSLLVLNKGTSLRYDADKRLVHVDQGQVYFDVKPNPDRSMVVHAGDSEIRVVGTSFDVMKDGPRVRVTVESGNVEVAAGSWWRKRVRLLVPGQSVEVDDWQGMQRVVAAPVASRISWINGKFVFQETPLPEVLTELNRYRTQALRLNPGDGLEELRFSGEFSLDEPDTVLEAMLEHLPIKVVLGSEGVIRQDDQRILNTASRKRNRRAG